MWARCRFDISGADLGYGMRRCLARGDVDTAARELEELWSPEGDALTCFSVRSGFDLVLQALALEPGDEILFSALNIRGMVKVAKRLDLVPVPVDLDLKTGRPDLASLERAISSRTKAMVIAPLFGARFDMSPIIEIARRHDIRLIEDCAQAFDGLDFTGSEDAAVSMFSFGPLKFATALGGAVFRVRDPDLLARMKEIQSAYPVQSSKAFFKRLAKFRGLRMLTTRPVLSAVSRWYSFRGQDYEDAVTDKVRGVAKLGKAHRIRKRCGTPLVALMKRRITRFKREHLAPRREAGRRLLQALDGVVTCPGSANDDHNFWTFPILVDEPVHVMNALRAAGFDAAMLRRSQSIHAPEDRPELEPVVARDALARLVVLPCYPQMPTSALDRQAEVIRAAVRGNGGA